MNEKKKGKKRAYNQQAKTINTLPTCIGTQEEKMGNQREDGTTHPGQGRGFLLSPAWVSYSAPQSAGAKPRDPSLPNRDVT